MTASRGDGGAVASAKDAARAWMHAYGIDTSGYTVRGGDHPMMDTLPAAFEAFAAARPAPAGEAAEVERLTRALTAAEAALAQARAAMDPDEVVAALCERVGLQTTGYVAHHLRAVLSERVEPQDGGRDGR